MKFFENFFGGKGQPVSVETKEEIVYSKEKLTALLKEWKNISPDDGGISDDYQGGFGQIMNQKLNLIIDQISNLPEEEIEASFTDAKLNDAQKTLIINERHWRNQSKT